jgi:hypothetical protein
VNTRLDKSGQISDAAEHTMNGSPRLRQVAHRLMTHELGTNRTPVKLALGDLNVFAKLLSSLTPMLGDVGGYGP